MKTDELIGLLAQGAGPAPRDLVKRRMVPVIVLGLAASIALAHGWLGFVPASTFAWPAPWFKLAYALAMTVAALWLASKLARPAAQAQAPALAVGAVALAAALVGVEGWFVAPADERWRIMLGHSWSLCPLFVLTLSLPALGGALWALRGLAPTRPLAAGFAAGLLAGALGAGGYALSCTELGMPFVAVWYTLGILLAGLLGALLGPRVLRW